jgi:hypothetical protein
VANVGVHIPAPWSSHMGFITPAKSRAPLWTLWRNRMMKDVTMLPTTIWDIYRICCFEPFSWLCGLCVQFCCASNLSVGQMMNWVMWIGIKLESAKPEMSNDVQRWVLLAWVLHWYSNSEIPPASQSWPLISGHTLCRAAWTAPVGRKREIWKLETQLVKIDRTLWNLELVYNRIYIYIMELIYIYIDTLYWYTHVIHVKRTTSSLQNPHLCGTGTELVPLDSSRIEVLVPDGWGHDACLQTMLS